MKSEELVEEVLDHWKNVLQETLGEIPEDAKSLLQRLASAAREGKDATVHELTANLLLLQAQAGRHVAKSKSRILEQVAVTFYRVFRAVAMAALLLVFVSSCLSADKVPVDQIRPAIEIITDRHDRWADEDPTNDPVPADAEERALWLETSSNLRKTVR